MNTIDFFDRGAQLFPDRACFICNDQQHNYRDIKALSVKIASALSNRGMGQDHKAAVLSMNDPIAFTCVLGVLRSGSVWVPLNPRNAVDDNRYLCVEMDVEILFYHSALADVIAQMRNALPKVRDFICIDAETGPDPSLDNWLAEHATPDFKDRPGAPDDTAMIIGTGGTTGRPKGVELSHSNLETYVACHLSCCPAPDDKPPVFLAAAPLTHAAGLMVFPVVARGGTVVVMPAPEPAAILAQIESHGVTDIFLPPTVIYMLLAMPDIASRDFGTLRYFYYGAAPMSVEKLKQAMQVFGPVMFQFFGQSEAPMSCTYLSVQDHFEENGPARDERLSSCGKPTPFVSVAIMDESGNLLPDGEIGEIVVRSSLVMKGYYKNPEATADVSQYGWHHTGDIGMRDAEGYYHIVDRKKDMIITGGFNVFSSEVEQAVLSHPAVQDCAVIGVPDDKWGEAVKAVVQLKPGEQADEAAIVAFCKEQIGSVKAPKSVEFRDDLPRSAVGKVLKREIRDQFWRGRARAV